MDSLPGKSIKNKNVAVFQNTRRDEKQKKTNKTIAKEIKKNETEKKETKTKKR